jgi:hypothetical protein
MKKPNLSCDEVHNKISMIYNSESPQSIVSDLLVYFEQSRIFDGERIVDYYESSNMIFEIYQIPYKTWLSVTGISKEVLAEKERARKDKFRLGDKLEAVVHHEEHILVVTCDEAPILPSRIS